MSDKIVSRPVTRAYLDNYDRIFKAPAIADCSHEQPEAPCSAAIKETHRCSWAGTCKYKISACTQCGNKKYCEEHGQMPGARGCAPTPISDAGIYFDNLRREAI